MATIPMTNRQARVLPKEDKNKQTWVPLSTEAGTIIRSDGTRCLVADVVAAVMEEHLSSSPTATFAVLEHGLRAIGDGTNGQQGRFFCEARGSGLGELYLFGCNEKLAALQAVMPEGSIVGARVEAKGGLYVTLQDGPGVAEAFVAFSKLHGSNRSPDSYRADMGAPSELEGVQVVSEGVGALEKKKRGPKKEKVAEAAAPEKKESRKERKRAAAAKEQQAA